MATSGVYYNKWTAFDIIHQALYIIGVLAAGETASSRELEISKRTLNSMIKAWESAGTRLFSKEEATLFLTASQYKYILGSPLSAADTTSYAHATEQYYSTTLTSDKPIGTTVLDVTSTSDMTANDFIGIVLEGAAMQWSTILNIVSPLQVEISDPLTAAVTNGSFVYNYTDKIQKPLNAYECRRQNNSFIDTPMWQLSHKEYNELPNKTIASTPVNFHYQPKRGYGLLYIWPASNSDSLYRINFTYDRQFQIFDSTLDNQDFPDEWSEAIIYQLACRLAFPFGKRQMLEELEPIADKYLDAMKNFDNEWGSIELRPDTIGE